MARTDASMTQVSVRCCDLSPAVPYPTGRCASDAVPQLMCARTHTAGLRAAPYPARRWDIADRKASTHQETCSGAASCLPGPGDDETLLHRCLRQAARWECHCGPHLSALCARARSRVRVCVAWREERLGVFHVRWKLTRCCEMSISSSSGFFCQTSQLFHSLPLSSSLRGSLLSSPSPSGWACPVCASSWAPTYDLQAVVEEEALTS